MDPEYLHIAADRARTHVSIKGRPPLQVTWAKRRQRPYELA